MGLRIAIPTDFSESALKAALYILELFHRETCTFYLTHTYTPSFLRAEYLLQSPGQIGLGDQYRERVLERLAEFEDKLKPQGGKRHTFYRHAAFNTLDAELNDMAGKESLDLIAMGTQGASGAKEVLFGTHAVQVMHRAACPVMVIPARAQVTGIRNILFPTDFAPDYSKLKLGVLEILLQRPGVRLHALHTYSEADRAPDRQKSRDQLLELFREKLELTETGEQPLIDAINAFAAEQPVELLVLVRNRHTALENLLVRPLVERIGFHSSIPLLVLPPQ